MTKIIDMGRCYTIVETRKSSGYPENQISVFGHGDAVDYYYDIYGTVKDNAVFDFNTETFNNNGTDNCHVTNHTNKTIHVVCSKVERGDSEATLGPNETKHFDTYRDFSHSFDITITVLDVKTYNKSTEYIRGFVS